MAEARRRPARSPTPGIRPTSSSSASLGQVPNEQERRAAWPADEERERAGGVARRREQDEGPVSHEVPRRVNGARAGSAVASNRTWRKRRPGTPMWPRT